MHSDIKINICLKEAAEHLHFSAMYFCDYIRFIFLSSGLSFTIHFCERVIEFKSLVAAAQINIHRWGHYLGTNVPCIYGERRFLGNIGYQKLSTGNSNYLVGEH